jgi:hypothetical protein
MSSEELKRVKRKLVQIYNEGGDVTTQEAYEIIGTLEHEVKFQTERAEERLELLNRCIVEKQELDNKVRKLEKLVEIHNSSFGVGGQ